MRRFGGENCKGFTLVEVLIATSLLALISIGILYSMRTSLRMWERAGSTAADVEGLAFAQGVLRRAIEGVYPRLGADGGVDFVGGEGELAFQGPSLAAVSIAGRTRYRFSVEERAEGAALLLGVSSEFDQPHLAGEQELLIENAESIRFSYRSFRDETWRDRWDERSGLPALVRIDVEFAEGDRRRWPPLIIRPKIDADVDCRYDPLTFGCRGRSRR